ncbi:MAG: GGDEF domain-containing protein [FCB group bacterium]|nr:GGDEF domain-containing protein [FCB group bacterium]
MDDKKILDFIENALKNNYKYDEAALMKFDGEEFLELFTLLILRVDSREMELKDMINSLEERVSIRTRELEDKNIILQELATIDKLTGLYNRRYFDEKLAEYSRLALRMKHCMSCIMTDIDYFKKFNDTYGHQAGDYVLNKVAGILRTNARVTDICARYGGEEFVILLPNTPIENAGLFAERIIAKTKAAEYQYHGEILKVTCSLGVAAGRNNDSLFDNLVKNADDALYRAKQSGRNCVMKMN